MNKRGRPRHQMTRRRRQVLDFLQERWEKGERISLGHVMRRCGLYDRSSVRRIIRDLREMGLVS